MIIWQSISRFIGSFQQTNSVVRTNTVEIIEPTKISFGIMGIISENGQGALSVISLSGQGARASITENGQGVEGIILNSGTGAGGNI